ncbi:helix-turn-helix transcriptional regulator [Nocardioides sp. YIM 152588]|uniref:helix-turn-helix transcriptional regulator n=1 Tax=Nocardioides sp. YIM 152588 TaxID=3158259 RepID=UPI0032E51F42
MSPQELQTIAGALGCARTFTDYLAAAGDQIARVLPAEEVYWVSTDRPRRVATVVRASTGYVDRVTEPIGDGVLGRHQLSLVVESTRAAAHAWVVGRETPAFTDDEAESAGWLLPVLTAYHRSFALRPPEPLEQPLTDRETEVLALVAQGLTATAIGRRLGISDRTVSKHLEHAYAKLGEHDRLLATRRASALGILR